MSARLCLASLAHVEHGKRPGYNMLDLGALQLHLPRAQAPSLSVAAIDVSRAALRRWASSQRPVASRSFDSKYQRRP